MKAVSKQQKRIIEFIKDYIEQHNMSPTIYEIANGLDIKASTVSVHIKAMQKKKLLTRTRNARSIKLIDKNDIILNYRNKPNYYPLYNHPMDVDFGATTIDYIYHVIKIKYTRYVDDMCLLKCDFISGDSYNIIKKGDVVSLIRKPEHILLIQSDVLLLVWTPEKDYYFTIYNARECAETGYKIIGLVMDILHPI